MHCTSNTTRIIQHESFNVMISFTQRIDYYTKKTSLDVIFFNLMKVGYMGWPWIEYLKYKFCYLSATD